jgi:hypothetical protein
MVVLLADLADWLGIVAESTSVVSIVPSTSLLSPLKPLIAPIWRTVSSPTIDRGEICSESGLCHGGVVTEFLFLSKQKGVGFFGSDLVDPSGDVSEDGVEFLT